MRKIFSYAVTGIAAVAFSQIAFAQSVGVAPILSLLMVTPGISRWLRRSRPLATTWATRLSVRTALSVPMRCKTLEISFSSSMMTFLTVADRASPRLVVRGNLRGRGGENDLAAA